MTRNIAALLIASLVLSACGAARESRLNPFNWFGRSQSDPVATQTEDTNPLIPQATGLIDAMRERRLREVDLTTPITTVTGLVVERVPGGAIIRAAGRDPQPGTFNVEIVPATEEETPVEGVLSYTLERQLPPPGTVSGQAQEVTAARKLTDQQLEGVRTIRVAGVENARTVRR